MKSNIYTCAACREAKDLLGDQFSAKPIVNLCKFKVSKMKKK